MKPPRKKVTAEDCTKGDEATLRRLSAFADGMSVEPSPPRSMLRETIDELSAMGREPLFFSPEMQKMVGDVVRDELKKGLGSVDAPAADGILQICDVVRDMLRELAGLAPQVMKYDEHDAKMRAVNIAPALLTAAAQLDVIGGSLRRHWETSSPKAEPEIVASPVSKHAAFLDALEEIE